VTIFLGVAALVTELPGPAAREPAGIAPTPDPTSPTPVVADGGPLRPGLGLAAAATAVFATPTPQPTEADAGRAGGRTRPTPSAGPTRGRPSVPPGKPVDPGPGHGR
jgi:hypothetical protein